MSEERDNQLIAEYDARRAEEAFAALVRQHVNLVFATALRQVGDSGAAEEITQNVFVALAQASGKLKSHPTIAGWLHRTTLNKSREWLRSELRRRRREQVAVDRELTRAEGESVWSPLVPLLDEALLKLHEPDRAAVILHYLEGHTFQEIGSTLGVTEDTARKRVNRCLHELTDFFQRRGFAVPALSAGAPLFALASHPAPAGLAASVTTAGLAAHSATSISTLTLLKGALKIMAWTNAKTAIAAGAGILLVAGTATVTVKEIQDHRANDWQKQFPGAQTVTNYPEQVAIRPAPPSRSRLVQGNGTFDGKFLGLGWNFNGMVQCIEQIDKEHVIVSAPLPAGRFDYIANLSSPDGNNFSLNQSSLEALIRKKFDLQIRREHMETNVLCLTVESANAPGLKPNSDEDQNGPRWTRNSLNCHGGSWLLVQALEDGLRTVVVDRTGLSGHYDFKITWTGRATREKIKQALQDQLGLELAPSQQPIAVPMWVVEKATQPPRQTIHEVFDLQPDGTAHVQVGIKQTNRTGGTISEDYIDNVGGLNITRITDDSGQPMKYTIQPDYLAVISLNQPVPPGAEFSYTVECSVANLIQATDSTGGFACQMTNEIDGECITHSIEEYRLPPGAVLLKERPADLKEAMEAGQIALRIDRTIPPGGLQITDIRYRLASAAK